MRRAFAGDNDAALELAVMLDDVNPKYRRLAAEGLARLAVSETFVHISRAFLREKDETTLQWLSVAALRSCPEVRWIRGARDSAI